MLTAVALAVLSLPVAATAQELNDVNFMDDPNLFAELRMPGTVEGTGTYFEVADSNYIDITFESTEPVHLRLESVPRMVIMEIERVEDADSTQITLGGFAPDTTYYKYEDDYHNEVAFTTDESGACTYTQDLTERHLVFIQPSRSTIFLSDSGWSNPAVGTWDPCTLTATLTGDVYETIQIDSDGITLDGGGFSAIGAGSGYGVYLNGRTGVTITDLTVEGFSYGIYLYGSSNNNPTNNTASNNNRYGICIHNSSGNNTLTGNTMSANRYNFYIYGSLSSHFDHDINTTNTVEGQPIYYVVGASDEIYDSFTNAGVFYAIDCNNITIRDLTPASNNHVSVFLLGTHNSTIENVSASNSYYGIQLYNSTNNTLTNNAASNNGGHGITLDNSTNNTLTGNITNSNYSSGIFLASGSGNNTLIGNTASNNFRGINLYPSSNNNTLTGNITNSNGQGIDLHESNANNLTNNTASNNNSYGIYIFNSSGNILTGNTMSANRYNFYVAGYQSSDFDNNIDTTNTVDGKPIYYVYGDSDTIYDNSTAPNAGVFYAINCYNITIKGLGFTKNGKGVTLYNTHYSTIENITASNNQYGISLQYSSNNTITDCNSTNNELGIYLRTGSSNNTLTGNTASNNKYGIYLYQSTSNTLTGNIANSNDSGIFFASGSSNNTLTVNTVSNNGFGIYINGSTNNTLTNNTASNNWNGITLLTGTNTLTNNTASNNNGCGITIFYSSNTLTGNTMSSNRYNFNVGGSQFSHFDHNIDTTNTVEGQHIYYLVNEVGGIYDSTTAPNAGLFYAIGCDNIIIRDLTLANNNYVGVYLWATHNSTIENISTSNNYYGISLSQSTSNTLTGSTASNNSFGIYLYNNSSNNLIYNNNFIDNPTQASVSGGSGNVFNLAAPTGGNYWSNWTGPDVDGDGFVDFPYVFNGGQDNLPLVGEVVSADTDGDGVPDEDDNCPEIANATQSDIDGDGVGDLCDVCPADELDECDPTGSTAEEIDPDEGGTIETPDDGLVIVIDPDDLDEPVTISVTQIVPQDPEVDIIIGTNPGWGQAIAVYDLRPDGMVFEEPVAVTITADVTNLNQNQRNRLGVYLWDTVIEKFVLLENSDCSIIEEPAGTFTKVCTVEVYHFSIYALIMAYDTTPPTITCPPDVTLECPADTSTSTTGVATATDDWDDWPAITASDNITPGCGNTEIIVRTWTATDASNNSSSCIQTIMVVDTTAPVIDSLDGLPLLQVVGSEVQFTAGFHDTCGDVIATWDFPGNQCVQ
jgi:parallel beta-helix repeat protein